MHYPPSTLALLALGLLTVAPAWPQEEPPQAPMQPDVAAGPGQQETLKPNLVREGADLPLLVCVDSFLIMQASGPRMRKALVEEGGADRDEWVRILQARVEARARNRDIQEVYEARLQAIAPLRTEDYDTFVEGFDRAGRVRRDTRAKLVADVYSALLADLDPTTELALRRYLEPPRCGDVAIAMMTNGDEWEAEHLEREAEFERRIGRVKP